MHRIADVAVAVLVAALVLAAPSAARADSSGATRFDFHYCSLDGTFCSDGTTLQNLATTPSGRMVLTYHSQYSNTFSGFGCTGQTQERDMTTYLLTPDATGAYHFTNKGQTTVVCSDGTSTTCHYMYVFTLANNEVRAYIPTVDCTPATTELAAT